MKRALATILVFLAASTASAQSTDASLKVPMFVFASAATSDWITTYYGVSHRQFQEGNVLIAPLQRRPALMVASGAGMDVLTGLVLTRFIAPKHPKLAKVTLYLAAGYRAYLCAKGARYIAAASAR